MSSLKKPMKPAGEQPERWIHSDALRANEGISHPKAEAQS